MMRTLALLLALASSTLAPAQTILEKAERSELVFMANEEPAMRQAFIKARQTLDDFLKLAASPPDRYSEFAMKVAVSEGKNTEYFWIIDFRATTEDGFEGEIGNDARLVKSVQLGQRYRFPKSRVVDWVYLDKADRRMVGNFTLCALLTKEPRREAEATKRRFKLNCDWLQ